VNVSLRDALGGALAAVVGVTSGNLVASLTNPDASPVLAVGSQVIDLTPTPLKQWAVATFGTADKPILVGSVAAAVGIAAAVTGVLARRRFTAAAGLFGALGASAAVIAVLRPGGTAWDAIPSLITSVVAVLVLHVLMRLGDHLPSSAYGVSRRAVFVSGGLVLLAAALESSARFIVSGRTTPADLVLPAARDVPPPLRAGVNVEGITPFRTSNREFYRVDTRLSLPTVDVDMWRLRIDGDVQHPLSLTFDELTAMELIERDITITCVSNEVGGRYVGGARWLGVRLTDVLDRAGIDATSADQILSTDVDGMTISTPRSIALDGRDSMIAIGMNGAPLPTEHGFPARLIVPGLYGFVGATKWLTRMTLTTYAKQDAYWTKRGWATDAPIKPSSRIDTPRPFEDVKAGPVTVGGVAWAQHQGGIVAVEVSIDAGPWAPARLGPSAGQDYWRQWYLRWEATPGRHTLAARAITGGGRSQSARRVTPFPAGSSGIQRLALTVT
jgi:DMSO/TMAO reductase YedYZ molybdopterin-dependent catalytic subunit